MMMHKNVHLRHILVLVTLYNFLDISLNKKYYYFKINQKLIFFVHNSLTLRSHKEISINTKLILTNTPIRERLMLLLSKKNKTDRYAKI